MKFFAVTGKPILFSRSPELFNSFFKQQQIEAKYFRMAAETAQEAVRFFKELGLSGMSVTAPFKEDIMPFLDHIDQRAQAIGSVNTVVNRDGRLYGYNTDYNGIVDTLKDVADKKVLLLGAGGAAKAVVYSLQQMGAELCIYNRTESKAQALAEHFKVTYITKSDLKQKVQDSDIIINTLPSGIKILEDDWLNADQTMFDAIYHNSVYKPVAENNGMSFFSGEDWLIHQAIPAFKLFFDSEDYEFERPDLSRTFSKKVSLTGFMGSGKSVVGEELAKEQNSKFFCTDTIVSNKEGSSISQIFETHGEAYFRETEHVVLKMLSSMDGKAIIASGGGMVLDPRNQEILSDAYTVVCLYANPQAIMARVNPESRPVLKGNFNIDFVTDLMQKRKPFYLSTADIIINTSDKSIEEIKDILKSELSYLC
jgi:shikimate dehydrogenase